MIAVQFIGTDANAEEVRSFYPAHGRYLNADDVDGERKVCVLEWKVANTGIFSIADAPGVEASSRPGIDTPIENLYLVGNNIREARGLAYQGLAHSAILCTDKILGKSS